MQLSPLQVNSSSPTSTILQRNNLKNLGVKSFLFYISFLVIIFFMILTIIISLMKIKQLQDQLKHLQKQHQQEELTKFTNRLEQESQHIQFEEFMNVTFA